jgi:hypothetical protein
MRQVISASRRTDVPMHFSGWLSQAVRQGAVNVLQPYTGKSKPVSLRPEDVHTMVLWSKDFRPLLHDISGIREALSRYDQIYCHLTVTGLGGTPLEPGSAPWQEVMAQLPTLIEWTGDARRVSLRYDPIVHWHEGQEVRSNLSLAEPILRQAAKMGITAVRFSFATLYGKVSKRKGWRWYDPPQEQKLEITQRLVGLGSSLGLALYACSQSNLLQAGAAISHCIDGELLTALHPMGLRAETTKDPGQRKECGCTTSVDIGSYTMRCPNGCRYCYANPQISADA